ncbi:hypothetical protein [Pseudopedobacter saltans]|uniref:hypothetical protein n=1 Tax=Pseudopedobacter saltans TaxID=151895 RepID=UPI0011D28F5C|nr:hypothetical protein [Pseudopedobacter saltans]
MKKKIDLALLRNAEPNLFDQFKSHYALMGEKSFDHTKKYWFNKLRHSYPLSAEEEIRLKELFKGEKTVDKAEAIAIEAKTETAVAKPAGFKPKFKAPIVKKEEHIPASSTSTEVSTTEVNDSSSENKPPEFKPRFKPGVTKTISSSAEEKQPEEKPTVDETAVAKPSGFIPRFKAGTTKISSTDTEKTNTDAPAVDTNTTEEISKPIGFRPRFKANQPPVPLKEDTAVAKDPEKTEVKEEVPAKTLGFKPRFKAGQTKTIETKEDIETPSVQKDIEAEVEGIANIQEETKPDITAKPLGFKPRFKAGQTKTIEEKTEKVKTVDTKNSEHREKLLDEVKDDVEGSAATASPKPLGFKPKFKPKNKNDE